MPIKSAAWAIVNIGSPHSALVTCLTDGVWRNLRSNVFVRQCPKKTKGTKSDFCFVPLFCIVIKLLFNSNRFRQISRLIDVAAAADGDVVREQLQRNDR